LAIVGNKVFFQSGGGPIPSLNGGISYLVSTYTGSPAYLKDMAGRPLIFFFINQYYPTEYGILSSSGIDTMGTSFVMYEPNGFPGDSPPSTVGEYGWVNPADGASSTQTTGSQGMFNWESDFGMKGLSGFLETASSNQTSYIGSEAY